MTDDAAGLSAAFHVSMKDSSSVPLVVEVFSVRFVNREGHAAYFVGIREFTDTNPMVGGSAPAAPVRHGGRRGGDMQWMGPMSSIPTGGVTFSLLHGDDDNDSGD